MATEKLASSPAVEASRVPKVPLLANIEKEALRANPEHKDSIERTFGLMNRQFFENYRIFDSQEIRGVSFAHTTLTIDRNVIEEIGGMSHMEGLKPQVNKNEEVFLEPSFALPIEGDPATSSDVAAYIFLQKLTIAAAAIKRGEEPGRIRIHVYGQPEAQHGHASVGFLARMFTDRFNEQGRVYAELVAQTLEGVDLDKTKIRFQGGSKGAVTIDKTYKHLPEELKTKTAINAKGEPVRVDSVQMVYDNPVGIHSGLARALKALNELGIVVDIGRLTFKEPLLRDIAPLRKDYESYLARSLGVQKQTKREQAINWLTFIAETIPLAVGNKPEHEATAITSRLDVTNVKRKVFTKLWGNRGRKKPIVMYQDGKTRVVPIETDSSHAYNFIHRMLAPGRIGKRMQVIEGLAKAA